MDIPNDFIRSIALWYVRSVVPKPGIVIPRIPFRDNPSLSKVFTQTSSASVESRPPEIPTTAVLAPVWTNLCASPATWIENTSSQCSFSSIPCGTKGWALNFRVKVSSLLLTNSVAIETAFLSPKFAWLAAKVVFILRSARMRSTSISLIISCSFILKRSLRASSEPFS